MLEVLNLEGQFYLALSHFFAVVENFMTDGRTEDLVVDLCLGVFVNLVVSLHQFE